MNCKPGDLAVVVGSCDISGDYLLGRIFTVTRSFMEDGEAYWEYEGATVETPFGTLEGIADDNLKPIRDPGDDAQDETLLWLLTPTPVIGFTKETAE